MGLLYLPIHLIDEKKSSRKDAGLPRIPMAVLCIKAREDPPMKGVTEPVFFFYRGVFESSK